MMHEHGQILGSAENGVPTFAVEDVANVFGRIARQLKVGHRNRIADGVVVETTIRSFTANVMGTDGCQSRFPVLAQTWDRIDTSPRCRSSSVVMPSKADPFATAVSMFVINSPQT